MFLITITSNYLCVVALRSFSPGSAPAALAALCKWNKQGGPAPKPCGREEREGERCAWAMPRLQRWPRCVPTRAVLSRTSDGQLDPVCPPFAFLSAVGASASDQTPDTSQHVY